MRQLCIVQPYVPAYRKPFFDQLADDLRGHDIALRVVAGTPHGDQGRRGDAAAESAWLTPANIRVITVFRRSLNLTSTRPLWRDSDGLIVPHLGTSIDAATALTLRTKRLRVGVWGHIDSYVAPPNPIDAAIERWQLRRADHVFAYMPRGAQLAQHLGVDPEKVTTVMNTIDTAALRTALDSVTDQEVTRFLERHQVPDAPRYAVLGGLDSSKKTELLVASLDRLAQAGVNAHFLIAGWGAQAVLLDPARRRRQVTMLGYVTGREKALLLKASRAIANPGRIGLVAVDALVAQLPIITTSWPYHAPEADYLVEGSSRFSAADDPDAFAELLRTHLTSPAMDPTGTTEIELPSLRRMVENFSRGVRGMLAP